ncbi:MAG: hypothetical protein IKA32_03900, partial [Lentisphaeria bacterium]|nr:hypothetical protein [Lentisphaeria bacterium]
LKEAAIRKAEGEKEAAIRSAEGEKQAEILRAEGIAQARVIEADAEKAATLFLPFAAIFSDAAVSEKSSDSRLHYWAIKSVCLLPFTDCITIWKLSFWQIYF